MLFGMPGIIATATGGLRSGETEETLAPVIPSPAFKTFSSICQYRQVVPSARTIRLRNNATDEFFGER